MMLRIQCSILDWSTPQPVQIRMPIGSTILKVLYHDKYDHLYFIADPHNDTEVREFVVGKSGNVFEPMEGREYKHIGSTVDEESTAWHIFELVSYISSVQRPSVPPPRKKR